MSRSTGTAKGVSMWLRSQRLDAATSSFVLAACEMDGRETVASWDHPQVSADPEKWCEEIIVLVDEDAAGRGRTTRYELVHQREQVTKGTTVLRRVIAVEDLERDKFDGTSMGLVSKLLGSLEKAHSQLLDGNRIAVETQTKAMQLLGQSYAMLAAAQQQTSLLHGQVLEGQAAAIVASGNAKPKGAGDDIVTTLIREVGPDLAAGILDKVMPHLLPDMFKSDDKPTSSSVVDETAQAAE